MRPHRGRVGVFFVGTYRRRKLVTQSETSVLVIGPTRSGKTSGLVIPNLFDWDGPAIATSTKSELVELTAGYRQSLGPVHVYDPTGEIGGRFRSVTWSPIAGCDDLDRAWTVASWLCASLQQGGGRGDNDWAHWAESGKLLIAPLLYVAAISGRTIVDVRTWVHGFDIATPLHLLEELLFDPTNVDDADPVRAMSMLASVDQRPERERAFAVLHHFVNSTDRNRRGDQKLRRRQQRIRHAGENLLRQRIIRHPLSRGDQPVKRCSDCKHDH